MRLEPSRYSFLPSPASSAELTSEVTALTWWSDSLCFGIYWVSLSLLVVDNSMVAKLYARYFLIRHKACTDDLIHGLAELRLSRYSIAIGGPFHLLSYSQPLLASYELPSQSLLFINSNLILLLIVSFVQLTPEDSSTTSFFSAAITVANSHLRRAVIISAAIHTRIWCVSVNRGQNKKIMGKTSVTSNDLFIIKMVIEKLQNKVWTSKKL